MTPTSRGSFVSSRKAKVIAWVNVFSQILFPLSLSFTPAIVAANQTKAAVIDASTLPYLLGEGETVTSVAKKHNISVEELQKLNRYRTFSKDFISLGQGDEIDVPRSNTPVVLNNSRGAKQDTNDNQLAQNLAKGGQLLASGDTASAANNLATSTLTNQVNSSANQWLNQFGTARVQMKINDDFHLDSSAMDLLVPAYDRENSVLFTQLGLRNKDDRNTVNLGAGARLFEGHWMYGANSFFDYDMTGENRRIGVGLEAWTDYLKLSANSYFRISDWRQSRDFADYNERPANGYDLRAEAYLPAYPQLGGKFTFEQYKGDDVGLFGKDNRQKDPHAFTAGLNYTPVPLFSVGAEHRMGKNNQNDSNINLALNYRLGESLSSQLDPLSVSKIRTLAGSRLDLVDRNNEIVLDYQKQDLIRLTLPERIEGEATKTVLVTAKVQSKYSLERIEWDSAELVSAGGSIRIINSHTAEVTLPAYLANSANAYVLNAVAFDVNRNTSNRATTVLSVAGQAHSTTLSTLVADKTVLQANGTDSTLLTLNLKDTNGAAIAGQKVTFKTSLGSFSSSKLVVSSSDGIYTTTLVAGNQAGKAVVTVYINDVLFAIEPLHVLFNGDASQLNISNSLISSGDELLVADGKSKTTITLTLRDNNNNSVAGQDVVFGSSLGTIESVIDNGDGTYTATLKAGTIAGDATLSLKVNGNDFPIALPTFKINGNSQSASVDNSQVVIADNTLVANRSDTTTITLALKDANGNPITGQNVVFNSSLGTIENVIDNGDGTYTATFKAGTKAGDAVLSVKVNGNNFPVDLPTITLSGDAARLSTENSNVTVSNNNIVANGSDTTTIILALKDANGNPVTGQDVVFDSSLGTIESIVDNGDGTYTATLKAGTNAGGAQLSVKVNGSDFPVSLPTVTLNGDAAALNVGNSTGNIANTNLVANGSDNTTITLSLKDSNNNPVTGQNVVFDSTLGTIESVIDNGDGTYTATFKAGVVAGDAVLSVNVNGNNFPIALPNITLTGDVATLSADKSQGSVANTNLVANGSDTTTITLALKDANGNQIAGQTVAFDSSLGAVESVVDNGDGTYTATFKAGIITGDAVLSLKVNGNDFPVSLPTITLNGDANNLSASDSQATVANTNLVANGSDNTTITLALKDVNGNPVTGQDVVFDSTLGTIETVIDNGDGTYTATFKAGAQAGDAVLSVKVNGNDLPVSLPNITLVGDSSALSAAQSQGNVANTNLVANGSDNTTVTLTLKDANGNPIAGQNVVFDSSLGTIENVTDNGDGTYTASFKAGTSAGNATLSVKVNGNDFPVALPTITLNGDASDLSVGSSQANIANTNLVANGSDTTTITLALKDANGNPVIGQDVLFDTTLGTIESVIDNGDGTYTATFKAGTEAGSAALSVKVNGTDFPVALPTITLNGDASDLSVGDSQANVANTNLVANGSDTTTITLALKDANGNPVTGQDVVFDTTLGTIESIIDNGDGTYTATFKAGTEAGNAALSVKVNGTDFPVALPTITLNGDVAALSVGNSAGNVVNTNLVANGSDTTTVILSLKDTNGNPISGQDVVVNSTSGTIESVIDNGDGTYTATFKAGTVAGEAALSVKVNGNDFAIELPMIKQSADASQLSTTDSTLVVEASSLLANGTDTTTLILTLKDINQNLVAGQVVTFEPTYGTAGAVTDNGDGTYSATYTAGTLTGLEFIGVKVAGNPLEMAPGELTLRPAPVDLTLSIDNQQVNIGQTVNLTITAKYKGTNTLAPNIKTTFVTDEVRDRKGKLRFDSGKLQIDGTEYLNFTGMTDSNGQLVVAVTDPAGIGVKTSLQAIAESGDNGMVSMIFKVITSPDSPLANMYGYMSETITVDGITFKRPQLSDENTTGNSDSSSYNNHLNEKWALYTRDSAIFACSKVPTRDDMLKLYNMYPTSSLTTQHGWRTDTYRYRTGTISGAGYDAVNFRDGTYSYTLNTSWDYLTCLQ